MPQTLAWFRTVASRPAADYRTQVLALDHPAALRDILQYNYSVATQAGAKVSPGQHVARLPSRRHPAVDDPVAHPCGVGLRAYFPRSSARAVDLAPHVLAKVQSFILVGIDPLLCEVEVDVAHRGLAQDRRSSACRRRR